MPISTGVKMPKLNQIVAIEKGVKNQQNQVITEAYHAIQKANLFTGIARSYRPKDEDGDKLPGESTQVQTRVDGLLSNTASTWGQLVDITMTKDVANCAAKADVEVDGTVVLTQVPVTTLLFLEKQLVDIHTFIKKLPVLDPSERWERDPAQDCWATKPSETVRTKKIMRNHVKAEATPQHPAQVEVYSEDVIAGFWSTIKYSGAMPAARISELLARVEKLQRAVKFARESANVIDVTPVKAGEKLFGYLLG
jgi:hypothetical protein